MTAYKVFVVGIEDGHFSIDIANNEDDFLKTTVIAMRKKIHERRGEIEPEMMRLLFAGKQLEDYDPKSLFGSKKNTLADYNIQNNSTISIVIRVHGGTRRVPVPPLTIAEKVHDMSDKTLIFTTTEPDAILGDDDCSQPRVKMSCGHFVDSTALTQYCRSLIDTQTFNFTCPGLVRQKSGKEIKCDKEWPYVEVRKKAVLNEAECLYYESKLSEYAAATYCDLKECPWCRSFIEREDQFNLRVTCPICTKKGKSDFCWNCKEAWSEDGPTTSDTKCGNPICEHPDIPSVRDCPMIILGDVGNLCVPSRRACPTCGLVTEHSSEGCKYVICQKCKGEFCFACLKSKTDCLKLNPASWYKTCANPVAQKQTKIPLWSKKKEKPCNLL